MTDELKQLALRTVAEFDQRGQYNAVLNAFREVQRQTVEAAAWSPYTTRKDSAGQCAQCKRYMPSRSSLLVAERHCTDCPIRALLSPSQEVTK